MILQDLVLASTIAIVVVYLLGKLKVPTLLGFLFAGVLLGEGGLRLVGATASIQHLAEIGVMLLLFNIGSSFPLRELKRLKPQFLWVGCLQVVGTMLVVAILCWLRGMQLSSMIFYGALLAMSSTAIVFKLLEERGENDSPHGRLQLSILIIQDLAVIPLMVMIPLLHSQEGGLLKLYSLVLGKSLLMVALLFIVGKWLLPRLLEHLAYARSKELFTLTAILTALGTALVANKLGISLPLGAFLAGMVIAESAYAHQLLAEITPLRNALSSIFFISIGLLVDARQWLLHPIGHLAPAIFIILAKTAIIYGVALAAGFGKRVALLTGLGLAQIGEFSFILAQVGFNHQLLSQENYQRFLSISVFTMIFTPLLMRWGSSLSAKLTGSAAVETTADDTHSTLKDHVIIIGYGINGRSVAKVLRRLAVQTWVIELNPSTVKEMMNYGEVVLYGDATQADILKRAQIETAKVLVIAVADPIASRSIVRLAKQLNPKILIMVRTRYISEVDELYQLGASEVIPEEFETAIKLVGLIMTTYGASDEKIQTEVRNMRQLRPEITKPVI